MSLSKFVVFSCLIWNFSQASEIIPGSGAIAKLIIDQNSEVSLEVSMQIGDIQIMNTVREYKKTFIILIITVDEPNRK